MADPRVESGRPAGFPLQRAALDASIAAHGPEHLEVARALDRLAGAVESEGHLREAERLERESLAMLGRLANTAEGGK